MLPTYSLPFQPYLLFPGMMPSGNQIIYQNNTPFVFQSFIGQPHFSTQNSNQEGSTQLPLQFVGQLPPFFKLQGLSPLSNQDLSKTQNKTVKEKIIKKTANRPSEYLTERKYYLAQTLSPQTHAERSLRPRQQKKKSHKTKENSLHRKQHIDSQVDKPLPACKEEQMALKEQLTLQKQKLSDVIALKQEYQQAEPQMQRGGQEESGKEVVDLHAQIMP